MKNLFKVLSMVCAFAFMVACSSSSQSSPSGTAENYAKAMKSGNFKAIVDLIYINGSDEEVAKTKEQYLSILDEKGKAQLESKKGISSYTISEETISEDGKKAKVKVELFYGDGTSDSSKQDFVCVDGKWYLKAGK